MNGMNKMNAGYLIINALIIVAVAVLYFLHFSSGDGSDAKVPDQKPAGFTPETPGVGQAIAFVNSDLLLEKYELVSKLAGQLEKESLKKEADLQARQKELETEATYFQESVQNQSLNEQSAQRIYEQLMAKQQEIYQIREQYAAELSQKEFEMNIILLDSVRNFLHRMNLDQKYDYVLNYNASGSILQASDHYDITEAVLEGLNGEYNAKYAPENK